MKLAACGQGDGRQMPYVVFLAKLDRIEALRDWYFAGVAAQFRERPADASKMFGKAF
jgi:hypothetical protein